MAKIAFLLLCHKDPDAIIEQAERLTAAGDCMAIHFDASSPAADYARIKEALKDNENVVLSDKRVRCGWGEWSLVQATLHAMRSAVEAFPRVTHFYMLSGDCMPIKSAEYTHDFLEKHDQDFIENFDYFESDWIKTGMKEERLIYRHFFNERTQKRLFYTSYRMQERLGLARAVPQDLQMMIGSQWWCLRRHTVEQVLEFVAARKDVVRFFRTTWIPDETFFQTIVRHLVPEAEISSRTLTLLMFSDYGMPVNFYNDHHDLLLSQDFLFARKISAQASDLKVRLGALYASERMDYPSSNEAQRLFRFMTGQGRVGRRFGPRFWERFSGLGRDREILVLVCKKWHVAKRLLHRITDKTEIRGTEYLFDEGSCPLPDLGGIEQTLEKRTRHRRAFMRLLMDHDGVDRMVICLDPSNLELLQDLSADKCATRILEIECDYSDEYLIGHAKRIGLAGDMSPQDTVNRLLPALRHKFAFETDQIRAQGFANLFRISEFMERGENVAALSGFLDIAAEHAADILDIDYLYLD